MFDEYPRNPAKRAKWPILSPMAKGMPRTCPNHQRMLDGWTNRSEICKPCRPVRDPRRPPHRPPSARMLAGWIRAGAICKPCGDISVAGMTELPPGIDHAVLVASVMAAVRGFSGYRGVPHLKVNWVGRFANGGPHANKKIPRPSHSGQPRATTDGRQPPECESATATERGPRTHDADEQSSESGSGCRE